MSDETQELLRLSQELLDAIATGDWSVYEQLCDPSLTAYEPEARGHLVEGLAFHEHYFQLNPSTPVRTTISSPHVRLMGDAAVVCYIRLMQTLDENGQPVTHEFEETRIWKREQGQWRHVHFHRSVNE